MAYEEEIKKLEYHLKYEKDNFQKIKQLDALRYFYKENEKDEDRVIYDTEKKDLLYSESIKIAIQIAKFVPEVLNLIDNENDKIEAVTIMKNNYYYLAGYLFEYYMIAIEFGIEPKKQFYAPRTSVLGPIAKSLSIFYYKPRGVMTISMPQGTGKEQPLSSNILTPEGWIKMGDVKVGTKVIAADGSIANVTGVYPKGVKDVYRVYFDDHTYVDCGLEHLWEVSTRQDRIYKRKPRVLALKDMINNVYVENQRNKNYSIRMVKPIKYTSKLNKNDIHPYVLGSLIANGSMTGNTLSFSTSDEEIVCKINNLLPSEYKVVKYSAKYVYGISKVKDIRDELGHFSNNKILAKIKEYGLKGKKSENKFIPKKYLYSSYENRLELLKGLMDNDGYINKTSGTSCVYSTTSEQLKDDVLELVRSLGGKASFNTRIGSYKKDGKEIMCKRFYRVTFTIEENPFFVKRKSFLHKGVSYNYKKFITSIEKVRQEECQCIMIDHPEHLYVTDGYTLTHNTEIGKRFMSFAVGKDSSLPNMMVSYSAAIAKNKFFERSRYTCK